MRRARGAEAASPSREAAERRVLDGFNSSVTSDESSRYQTSAERLRARDGRVSAIFGSMSSTAHSRGESMDKRTTLTTAALAALTMAAAGCASGAKNSKSSNGSSTASAAPAGSAATGECYGVNTCKGTGECGGPGHSCAGQNSCKGQGWITLTQAACEGKHGTFKKG